MSESSAPVILVVEDEVFIRFDAADFLRDGGFEVIEAGCGDEALRVLESGARVDLVFTDIQMPGAMNGLDLAGHVYAHRPGLPVILTSGANLTMTVDPQLSVFGSIEPKPYDPIAITARIRAALASRPSA
jgi:CheY-like chemotaxis protein